jgi:hypothetical protein
VRIECEERMGLVSIVQNLKQEKDVVRAHSTPPISSGKSTDFPALKEDKAKSINKAGGGLQGKEQALHALFQAAMAKKEKKLARQRRG